MGSANPVLLKEGVTLSDVKLFKGNLYFTMSESPKGFAVMTNYESDQTWTETATDGTFTEKPKTIIIV